MPAQHTTANQLARALDELQVELHAGQQWAETGDIRPGTRRAIVWVTECRRLLVEVRTLLGRAFQRLGAPLAQIQAVLPHQRPAGVLAGPTLARSPRLLPAPIHA